MKKILISLILFLNLTNSSFSKILDLGSTILEVPNKYHLLNWSNSSINEISNSNNDDFINQLKQLNDLYKSGVLTKEEFEKAKKKILN